MNPYKILGLEEGASPQQIKAAYRKMAAKYHPDQGGDAWVFQQIQDAYDELTGKKKVEPKPKKKARPKPPQDDPFGFDAPPSPRPNSGFQNTSWQNPRKNKRQRAQKNALVFWVVGGVAAAVFVVLGSFGLWLLLRSNSQDIAAATQDDATKVSSNEPIESSAASEIKAAVEDDKPASMTAKKSGKNESLSNFEVLFDGTSLDNFQDYATWEKPSKGWKIVDGCLKFDNEDSGHLITKKQFQNFDLRFEWKVDSGAESGVLYRVDSTFKDPTISGIEYPLLDDETFRSEVAGKQLTASIGGLYAAPEANSKPIGAWNSSRIKLYDGNIEHWLNEKLVAKATVGSKAWQDRLANTFYIADKSKFAAELKGRICLQDQDGVAWFRNIRIKELASGSHSENGDSDGGVFAKSMVPRSMERDDLAKKAWSKISKPRNEKRSFDSQTVEVTNVDRKEKSKRFENETTSIIRGESEIFRLAVSSDGKQLATCSSKNGVTLWDIDSGEERWSTSLQFNQLDGAVEFTSSNEFVWVCGTEETVKLDARDGSKVKSFPIGGSTSAFSTNFRHLFVDINDGNLGEFNLSDGSKRKTHKNIWATNVQISPNSRLMLIGAFENQELRLVSLAEPKIVRRFSGYSARTSGIFSNDSRLVAQWSGPNETGSKMRHNVRIFEAHSGKKISELTGFGGWQVRVAFSPNNRKLATVGSASHKSWQGANSGADNLVRVWDVKTGKLLKTFDGHVAAAYDAVFTPDGRKLITAGHTGIIRIWDLD